MSTIESSLRYTVNDINDSVRGTNILLRGINALRLTTRDIKMLLEQPTIARFFWTTIQLTRTYNALRRIYILTMNEINKGTKVTRIVGEIAFREPKKLPKAPTDMPNFDDFNLRVDAFLDNRPITLDKLDLRPLPANTRIMLQAILEEESEITVSDMQQTLRERILHPEQSTGFLEANIGWMPEIFGTRIFANAYYSGWVEEGHDNFAGHHFMRDAFARTRLRVPVRIQAELNGLILNGT